MKGKRIKFKILIGVALFLTVFGALGMNTGPEREADKVLSNRFGNVTWNHELHVRMKEISNCSVCHHTDKPGDMNPTPCHDCHKAPDNQDAMITPELFMTVEKVKYEGQNGPPSMTIFHENCIGCHKAVKKGPVLCRDCHDQTFSEPGSIVKWDHMTHARKMGMGDDPNDFKGGCVACHHKDENAATEADYRPCGGCHKLAMEMGLDMGTGIQNHSKTKHGKRGGRCQKCHVEFNPENDNLTCADCHNELGSDIGRLIPPLEQAIHKKCGECHNKDNLKLEKTAPRYCSDCHTPDPSWIVVPEMRAIFWNHKKHGEFGEYTCEKCHHKDHPEGPKLACESCHGNEDMYDNPSLEEALKKSCLDCHREENIGLDTWESLTSGKSVPKHFQYKDEKGTFWWDHALHALDSSFSCRDCHHNIIRKDGKYPTAIRAGIEWTKEAKSIQNCENCHGEEGPVSDIAKDAKAPNKKEAFRKVCLECHRKLQVGTQNWKDFFRVEPLQSDDVVIKSRGKS